MVKQIDFTTVDEFLLDRPLSQVTMRDLLRVLRVYFKKEEPVQESLPKIEVKIEPPVKVVDTRMRDAVKYTLQEIGEGTIYDISKKARLEYNDVYKEVKKLVKSDNLVLTKTEKGVFMKRPIIKKYYKWVEQ